MEKNKKYLTGIVVIATVGLFAHQLGYYQANSSIKKSNRVSYIDGKQAVQKSEELTPDEVSKKEGINAEQIVIKIREHPGGRRDRRAEQPVRGREDRKSTRLDAL